MKKSELISEFVRMSKLMDKIDEELSDRCDTVIENLITGDATIEDAKEAKEYVREFFTEKLTDISLSRDILISHCNRRIRTLSNGHTNN